MARNRYGWEKRAKEMARKQKNDEKMKRRQGKIITAPAEETSPAAEETSLAVEVEEEIKTEPEVLPG